MKLSSVMRLVRARLTYLHLFGPAKACPESDARARKSRLLRRIFDAVIESGRHRSDREIAGILSPSGGRLTDAMEREMFQRRFASNWWSQ